MKNKLIIVIAAVCAVLCGAAAFIVTSRLSDTSRDENTSYVTEGISPEEQKEVLEKLYQNGFGCCIQEDVITEEISADASSLDLKTVKSIIADNEEICDILDEFAKIQQYPDFVGGSGLRHMVYWLNKEKYSESIEVIMILEQSGIYYTKYAPDGTPLLTETLRDSQCGK